MKVYKFGEYGEMYTILIEEDNGELTVALIQKNKVIEYAPKLNKTRFGYTRLEYGCVSLPYKDENGKLSEKYHLIYNE